MVAENEIAEDEMSEGTDFGEMDETSKDKLNTAGGFEEFQGEDLSEITDNKVKEGEDYGEGHDHEQEESEAGDMKG